MVTYHAPQTKYWRNISADSFTRVDGDIMIRGARCRVHPVPGLSPPCVHRWFGEDRAREQIDRRSQPLVNGRERIFVLDAHHVVVADEAQGADDALPFEFVVAPADAAKQPRPLRHAAVRLRVDDAVDRNVLPIERDVL